MVDTLLSDLLNTDFDDERDDAHETLIVDVNGFEGPLDLLLTLAKKQKVDLREISVVDLVNQYLAFIEVARVRRLELAADYLVMAAWLAYMKSHLLLPVPPEDDDALSGEEMAAYLARRLELLQAMRNASKRLMARAQLGQDFFPRGKVETRTMQTNVKWTASLLDLVQAYARQKTKDAYQPLHLERDAVYAVDEALHRLRSMLGTFPDWTTLQAYLPESMRTPPAIKSCLASTFAACLELVKEGKLEVRQKAAFEAIHIKSVTQVQSHATTALNAV